MQKDCQQRYWAPFMIRTPGAWLGFIPQGRWFSHFLPTVGDFNRVQGVYVNNFPPHLSNNYSTSAVFIKLENCHLNPIWSDILVFLSGSLSLFEATGEASYEILTVVWKLIYWNQHFGLYGNKNDGRNTMKPPGQQNPIETHQIGCFKVKYQ